MAKLIDLDLMENSEREHSPVDSSVGARLRARRKAMHLSGGQLGDKLGVSAMQITRYETGKHRIGASRLHAMAQILQVPVSYFFEGVEASHPAVALPTPEPEPEIVKGVVASVPQTSVSDDLSLQLQDLLTLGRMAAKATDPREKALIRRFIQNLPLFSDSNAPEESSSYEPK